MNLNNLPIGAKAKVKTLTATDNMRRRLLDIGLINGTVVECLGRSPQGDPSAYFIRGAVIAIRSEDCQDIVIENIMEADKVEGRYPIKSTQKC
ncbi:FeoA family protein [Candidatus Stoquefichus sp. SB1]|uniref:FeoA family protein n=1 Tax=Candidatus Stoquefichus sp. SB1 TaxID=1658109 RepID=UPI00067EE799|nr:FeoA family protein [Candidatus Stoquefichus sp. SB1]